MMITTRFQAMKKVIFLLLCWSLMQVLAVEHDWHPADPNAIHKICKSAYPLTPQTMEELTKGHVNDSPVLRGLLLCTAKGMNVYSTEKGFDADRLAYSLYRGSNRQCNRELVRECVTKHAAIQPEDAMVFSVLKCILEVEFKIKVDETENPGWNGCD